MSSFACWLCPEKFKSNRDRKNHLISRPHERMRVLCPFCPLRDGKKEKSLRRMSDLKVHIADSHKAEKRILSDSLPSDFFSEVNGFWLAVHPKDYLKLITPNSWRADAAVRARTEMIRWIRVNQLSKRRLQELEQGWEAARAPSLTPEEKFVPDYSEEPEEDLQARKRAREYSPSRPDLTSDFQLKTISLEGGVISVYITKEDEVYNVTLTPEAARNPQLLSSFMRKSQTLTHDPFFQTPPTMTPVTSPSIKKVLSIVLAVGPEHFQSIRNGTCPPAYVPSKMSSACHPQDPSPIPGQPESSTIPCQLQDLFSIDSQPEGPPTIDSQPEGPPTIDSQPENPPSNEHPDILSDQPTFAISVGFRGPPEISLAKDTPAEDPASIASGSILLELADPDALASLVNIPPLCTGGDSQRSKPASSFYADPLAPAVPNTTASSSTSSDAAGTSLTSSMDLLESHIILDRARTLLEFGVMPLLPPARRNWSGVAPFPISPDRPKLTWPPSGWETMTSDQKLQAWEFTALSLETDGVINSSSLTSSRSALLCKYNFLCLPGSAKPVMIKEEEMDRKLRFYNYKKLCALARKGVHSLDDNLFVVMLEAAFLQRKKTMDSVINIINAKNVPLRLF